VTIRNERESGVFAMSHAARKSPMLSAEQELELARAAQAGSEQAFEQLLRAHFRLVLSIARELGRYGLPADELVSEGMLGLVEAARRFDPDRGVRLAAYAAWWIRAYMRRYTIENRRIVRAPSSRHGRKLLANLRRTQRELAQVLGMQPNNDAVAVRLGVPVRDVEEMEAALSGRDVPCSHEPYGQCHEPVSEAPSPESIVADAEEREACIRSVNEALRTLTPRERAILQSRYLEGESTTLASIGRGLGLSRERVRQLEHDAQHKMRAAIAQSA